MTSAREHSSQVINAGIVKTLNIDHPSGGRLKRWATAIIFVVLAVGISLIWFGNDNSYSVKYKTAKVTHNNLVITITATGTLEPVNQVDVGSEISGTVNAVLVDANDIVKQGQTLATLNTDQQKAKVNQANATLQIARAKNKVAEVTVWETKNSLKRSLALKKSGVYTKEKIDEAQAAYDRAKAELLSTKGQIVQAEASLDAEKTLLAKTTIHSPINGVVLKRAVEPGQTVAATLQTPVLFVIAEDLTRMELHVAVDEADVGKAKKGQKAIFGVDAYPDETFPATITEVYFDSQTIDGVVTYETVLRVDNSKSLLRPGMTATADIIVNTVENTLLVPNAALRFTPPDQQKIPTEGSLIRRLMPRPPDTSTEKQKDTKTNGSQQRVWTIRDEKAVAIPLTTGATDGIMTEVITGNIEVDTILLINTIGVD